MFLLPSKFKVNQVKHTCKMIEKKNTKEHKMNFESTCLHDLWADLTETWDGMCPTLRDIS